MLSVSELWSGTRVAGRMMMMSSEDRRAFEALELRIRAILPEEYQDCYDEVEPVSMGSAALKYGRDGKVAWQDMWVTFCDLAMAGGPPHKGRLLMAGSREQIDAEPDRYRQVVEEICRGIATVTDLNAAPSRVPGWVRVECGNAATAGWLARAVVMENVSARCGSTWIDLPAAPGHRVEKEIKNVITVMAKTCHYWLDHTSATQQREIGDLFETIAAESPLIQPAVIGHDFRADADLMLRGKMAETIREATGLTPSDIPSDGWLGVVCPSVKAAIWMMRAMVASNVFARREDLVLFVPVNPVSDPGGEIVVKVVSRVHRFARVRSVL
jgi:sirohydrochlorin cobaltochelatase